MANKLNALPMYLGLDLRGGVHFLLELDLENLLSNSNKAKLRILKSYSKTIKLDIEKFLKRIARFSFLL